VTFTRNKQFFNIAFVVWQFWGRAAEASWTAKFEALFIWSIELETAVALGLTP
jgi:hypothetical protein